MKLLLLGKNGQVGWELQRALAPLGQLIALDRSSHLCGDLSDLASLAKTVRQVAPDVIVNAAAYTAVDKAESEPELACTVNVKAPAVLAREAKLLGAWLVHYSTDYVFDGSGIVPWVETATTNPLNVYGETKLRGEQAIQSSGCKHLIFRTSWVYGSRGNNFAKTILRLARERDSLSVINDQIGAPTGADLLADVAALVLRTAFLEPEKAGLYHLTAAGEVSWYDYARFVIEHASNSGEKLVVKNINSIPSTAYPTPAHRPHNSRLKTDKLQNTFSISLAPWQIGVARMLTEIQEKSL